MLSSSIVYFIWSDYIMLYFIIVYLILYHIILYHIKSYHITFYFVTLYYFILYYIFLNILYYRKLYLFVNIEIDSLHIYICVYICTALPSGKISEISKRQKLHGEANTKSHSLEWSCFLGPSLFAPHGMAQPGGDVTWPATLCQTWWNWWESSEYHWKLWENMGTPIAHGSL